MRERYRVLLQLTTHLFLTSLLFHSVKERGCLSDILLFSVVGLWIRF